MLQLRIMSALSFYCQRPEKEAKNMADLLILCGAVASELQERRKADSAEPVYQIKGEKGGEWHDFSKLSFDEFVSFGGEGRILYTAHPVPVLNDDLYKLANHVASSKNGLPEEWQDWAEELESEIRRIAMLRAEPVSEPHKLPKEVAGGESAIGSKQ